MSINKMLLSVNIRLSIKILILLFLCAAHLPSIESQPTNEVESIYSGSESPEEKPSSTVKPQEPEVENGGEAASVLPVVKKPSRPKPKPKQKRKPKRKSKKNKKQNKRKPGVVTGPAQEPGMEHKPKPGMEEIPMGSGMNETSKTPEKEETSSTEPHSENWSKTSGNYEKPGFEGKPEQSSIEPSNENWSESTEKSEKPEVEGKPNESSTEPCTENGSKSSGKSEKPGVEGKPEELSTEPCSENGSESSEKSEKPEMEGISKETSTEPCTDSSNSSGKSKTPSMEEDTDEPGVCENPEEMDRKCGKIIKGPIAPVFAPVGKNGEINYSVIPKYMEHLNKTHVAAIVVGGTTGEGLTMSTDQRMALLEEWIKEANKYDIQVIAQVGGAAEPSVLEMARHAQKVGACGLLVLPQMFYKPKNTEDLVLFLELVSKQAPKLILIYYDYSMKSGVIANMTELFDMATERIPNFKGVKSDLKTIFEAGGLLKKHQQIYLGNHQIAEAVLMGHESSIATVNNMFLDQVHEIIEALHNGDVKKARRLQKRLNKIVYEITDIGDFQGTMKAAFEFITGIEIGQVRRPQRPLERKNRNRVYEVLKRNGIQVKPMKE